MHALLRLVNDVNLLRDALMTSASAALARTA